MSKDYSVRRIRIRTNCYFYFVLVVGGYLLDSGSPYRLWSDLDAAPSAHLTMDLYGTGSMATACCTRR